jgi:hypothetical protein
VTTRFRLVAKKSSFPTQNGDENRARRQKIKFLALKRRREQGSSQKNPVSRLKVTTRFRLVAKKSNFSTQSAGENRARRQKIKFPDSK